MSVIAWHAAGTVFLRTVTANDVEYVQLVHNEWVEGRSKTRVLYAYSSDFGL